MHIEHINLHLPSCSLYNHGRVMSLNTNVQSIHVAPTHTHTHEGELRLLRKTKHARQYALVHSENTYDFSGS